MGFRKIIKKWGSYALGILALAGGMIANNSASVSAEETDNVYLVREFSSLRDGNSSVNNITLTNITTKSDVIQNSSDINAISISSQTVRFTGGTFTYQRNKNYFKIDVAKIDDFNFSRDVVIGENTSGTQTSGVSSGSFTFYLYNSSGGIEQFLERDDLYSTLNDIFHLCVREVITLDEGTTNLVDSNSTISSITLCHVELDENNQMAINPVSVGATGFSMLSSDTSYTNVDFNFYIRNLDDILFGTLDGAGENIYTQRDIDETYNSAYLDGHSDGYAVGSAPNKDSNGKYSYFFEYNSGESKVINVEEGDSNADTLITQIHWNGNSTYNYKWYLSGTYNINIDEFESIDSLTYDNIKRTGSDTLYENETWYFSHTYLNLYSASNSSINLVSFMNKVDYKELSTKILSLIFENEILPLNQDIEGLESMKMNFSHFVLANFGDFVSETESDIAISTFDSNIGIHTSSSGTMAVTKRSFNDLMYGVSDENEDYSASIGNYEMGFSDGYQAGLDSKGSVSGEYTEDDLNKKYEEGFSDGKASIDITSDNEEAINEYITSNNMKTEEEYLTYGEEKYTEGKEENANEYAERLNELDTTINNLNNEINELNSKINDYESTDDKYQVGYETGYNAGHSTGYQKGYNEALSEDIESYGEEQYQKGYNSGYSIGYNKGYSTAQAEKDEVIEDVEEEKNSLVEQVESLQNDITNLNNRINTLTGTINSMNELIDTKYQEGFDDGVESVDITSDNKSIYQKGYEDGYLQCEIDNPPSVTFPENTYEFGFKDGYANGYKEGKESVDVTIDNQQAIEDYINNENMKTEEEFLSYGEEKYSLGYKDNSFGKQVKRLGSNIGTFFVNIGKGIVQYVAFGWAWDKSGKFMPNF